MRPTRLAPGVAIVSGVAGVAIVSNVWTPHPPLQIDPMLTLAGPSASRPLGSDVLGRDVLSLLMVGARPTLVVVAVAVAVAMSLGTAIGVGLAMAPRFVRLTGSLGVDVVLALPAVLLAAVLGGVYGTGTLTASAAIGIALAAAVAQVTRREAERVLGSDFVLAGRASGAGAGRIVTRHVLPNVAPSLVVQSTGVAAVAVLAESTLAYLGLGTRPPTPSWGRMLAESQRFLLVEPLHAVWPGLAILITVLGLGLLGDALRERLDPTLRDLR